LLQRARRRISLYADDPPYGVDVDGLRTWADQVLADLAAGRAEPRVDRPRLRTP
jgi:hypothetical protein